MALRASLNSEDRMIKGIETVAKNVVNDASLDRTLKGIIIEVPNGNSKNQNEYKVKIQNAIFFAYSNGRKYTKNTEVYILIPNGDMSQTKTILSKVNEENIEVNKITNYIKQDSENCYLIEEMTESITIPSIEDCGTWGIEEGQEIDTTTPQKYILEKDDNGNIKKVKYYLYSNEYDLLSGNYPEEEEKKFNYPLKMNKPLNIDSYKKNTFLILQVGASQHIWTDIQICPNINTDFTEDFVKKFFGFEIHYHIRQKKYVIDISVNNFLGDPYKEIKQHFINFINFQDNMAYLYFDIDHILFYTELPETSFTLKNFNITSAKEMK